MLKFMCFLFGKSFLSFWIKNDASNSHREKRISVTRLDLIKFDVWLGLKLIENHNYFLVNKQWDDKDTHFSGCFIMFREQTNAPFYAF